MKYVIVWSCLLQALLLQGSDSQKISGDVEHIECLRRIILNREERRCFVVIQKMIDESWQNKKIAEMYVGDLHRSWPDEKVVDDTLYRELDREFDKMPVAQPRVYIELQPSNQTLKAKVYLEL